MLAPRASGSSPWASSRARSGRSLCTTSRRTAAGSYSEAGNGRRSRPDLRSPWRRALERVPRAVPVAPGREHPGQGAGHGRRHRLRHGELPLARAAAWVWRRRTSATTSGALRLALVLVSLAGRWPGRPRPLHGLRPARPAPADRAAGDVRSPRGRRCRRRASREHHGPGFAARTRARPRPRPRMVGVRGGARYRAGRRFRQPRSPPPPRRNPVHQLAARVRCLGFPSSASIGLIGVPLGVRAFVGRWPTSSAGSFDEQLADNLQVIASAQRAGHSFLGAIDGVHAGGSGADEEGVRARPGR